MVLDESTVQQMIQIEAAKFGCILLRNNSGAAKDSTGRVVRFGLGNNSKDSSKNFKSSDLIGVTPITITQEMVGKTVGVFTAIEVKKENWKEKGTDREKGQKNFIDFIVSKGGIAGFANSIDQLKNILGK